MAIRPIEAITNDPKLAKFLLSHPVKNKSLMFIWLTCENKSLSWMLVDGAFEGIKDDVDGRKSPR